MKFNPVLLYREDQNNREELEAAKKYFPIRHYRTECQPNDFVIGRYSVLPFYSDLEKDLTNIGAKLVNTHHEHLFIADFGYYDLFKDVTPETWREHEIPYCTYDGPFIMKGATNSRKHQWNTHMFAHTRKDAILIANELHNDMLLGDQDILFRKYVPLEHLGDGINGLPFSNEWRFFILQDKIIDYGFYWSSCDNKPTRPDGCWSLVEKIVDRMKGVVPFYCFDLAKTIYGEWIMIEMNSGQMAGLSDIDPDRFYKILRLHLDILL